MEPLSAHQGWASAAPCPAQQLSKELLPDDGQERKGATIWVTMCLPRGWQLQTQGCCFGLALLQGLATHPTLSTARPRELTPSSSFWGQLV